MLAPFSSNTYPATPRAALVHDDHATIGQRSALTLFADGLVPQHLALRLRRLAAAAALHCLPRIVSIASLAVAILPNKMSSSVTMISFHVGWDSVKSAWEESNLARPSVSTAFAA